MKEPNENAVRVLAVGHVFSLCFCEEHPFSGSGLKVYGLGLRLETANTADFLGFQLS